MCDMSCEANVRSTIKYSSKGSETHISREENVQDALSSLQVIAWHRIALIARSMLLVLYPWRMGTALGDEARGVRSEQLHCCRLVISLPLWKISSTSET